MSECKEKKIFLTTAVYRLNWSFLASTTFLFEQGLVWPLKVWKDANNEARETGGFKFPQLLKNRLSFMTLMSRCHPRGRFVRGDLLKLQHISLFHAEGELSALK